MKISQVLDKQLFNPCINAIGELCIWVVKSLKVINTRNDACINDWLQLFNWMRRFEIYWVHFACHPYRYIPLISSLGYVLYATLCELAEWPWTVRWSLTDACPLDFVVCSNWWCDIHGRPSHTDVKCECCNEMNYFHCHFAGQETTGNHLSFTLQQICRYPEVLKKWVVFAFGLERDDAKASCINGAIVKMEGLCVTVGRMIRRWNTFQSAPPPRTLYPPPSKT